MLARLPGSREEALVFKGARLKKWCGPFVALRLGPPAAQHFMLPWSLSVKFALCSRPQATLSCLRWPENTETGEGWFPCRVVDVPAEDTAGYSGRILVTLRCGFTPRRAWSRYQLHGSLTSVC